MLSHNIFSTIFVFPILNILVAFYKGLLSLGVPGAFGFAIILMTASIRLLFHPFFRQQLETSKKMQDLKPHLDKLSQKHKSDPKKLQQEQMRLYQEAGINPAAGCLFMIIQLPIFYALYNTFSLFLLHGSGKEVIQQINSVLYTPLLHIQKIDPWFFGINLAITPEKGGLWYYAVPVITGILQYFSVPSNPAPQPEPVSAKKGKKEQDKKQDNGDFQQAMNMQMKFIFPFMIGLFSYRLPVGMSLYWNIISLFTIMQYQRINKK